MIPATLLELAERHLMLTRPVARAHPDDEIRNRGQLGYRRNLLHSFVQFWSERKCPWPIRSALVMDWVGDGAKPEQPCRDRHRMLTIRGFLMHLRTIAPEIEIPWNVFRKSRRSFPRLLSDVEIAGLMNATARLRACSTFRRATMSTLLGLLASTGLRVGEALRLKEDEVYLKEDPPYLTIRDTKFGKSRIVVLHPTTASHLRKFERHRTGVAVSNLTGTFFTNKWGKPLSYNVTRRTFLRLLHHAGIRCVAGERQVTLHCFRHGFAVRLLMLWHQTGENVAQLLPHLSVYMGHLDPRDTYWYLTATPELLEAASMRFEDHEKENPAQ